MNVDNDGYVRIDNMKLALFSAIVLVIIATLMGIGYKLGYNKPIVVKQDTLENLAHNNPEFARDEACREVCQKYGHKWGEWELIQPCTIQECHLCLPYTHSNNPPWGWKRYCSTCKNTEYKESWSKKNPDVTEAMRIVAEEVAETIIGEPKRTAPPIYTVTNFFGTEAWLASTDPVGEIK